MDCLSDISLKRLNTCCDELQNLFYEVAKLTPIIVICGYRGKEDQELAFKNKHSKLPWPRSKHNVYPSMAVDIAPLPLDWKNINAFLLLSEIIKQEADKQGIDDMLTWGGDWKKFKDYPHWEIKK